MSASVQTVASQSWVKLNRLPIARSTKIWHKAVPDLLIKSHGLTKGQPFSRLFHTRSPRREPLKVESSEFKGKFDHSLTTTRVFRAENVRQNQSPHHNLSGRVFIVTGGAQGLGLSMAEGLAEAGGKVYCLDRAPEPAPEWREAQSRVVTEWGGSLHYRLQDVTDTTHLNELITEISEEHRRLDGVVAAAGIQQLIPAIDYQENDVARMLAINYTGVFMTATAAARQMLKYKCKGSICLIASMSGLVANKGLLSPVYNSSKAAVIQLARCLAMEWSPTRKDGTGGIRVNCISPGHILTPMVRKNFEEVPGLKEKWERENMMGRLADTSEFKGAAVFLLSAASSFMTGNNMIIDGGHTSW
ncbi:short chain dehydrogenase [Diaporthe amygdali]|uniref:short chain dehydrogenase n=1 Tax=Phomopsis amygdali TaxID=1214568 RepID=UPI0022FE2377|nr:short chain dehydrogenase [Diaporthe amygdali]KAJ0122372.1 short chain dehydrogenase [Diaporthe amygdali]